MDQGEAIPLTLKSSVWHFVFVIVLLFVLSYNLLI